MNQCRRCAGDIARRPYDSPAEYVRRVYCSVECYLDDIRARPLPPYEGDVDEIAVQRALSGERLHLTPAERLAAVAQLTAAGYSGLEIADRLRVTVRTVVRYRRRTRWAA